MRSIYDIISAGELEGYKTMKTRYLHVSEDCPDPEGMEQAGEIIKNGGLVAFPTETVYGLGGDALNPESSRKIYAAKGRPSDNPLIVHIADFKDMARLVKEVTPQAKKLAEAFWPGPLTMILPKSELVPYETTGGLDTVAVRAIKQLRHLSGRQADILRHRVPIRPENRVRHRQNMWRRIWTVRSI